MEKKSLAPVMVQCNISSVAVLATLPKRRLGPGLSGAGPFFWRTAMAVAG
jgi:hypothetical protein